MANPTMLYRVGGPHQIDGGSFSYVVVDSEDEAAFKKALSEGWHLTPADALAYHEGKLEPAEEKIESPRIPSVKPTRARV